MLWNDSKECLPKLDQECLVILKDTKKTCVAKFCQGATKPFWCCELPLGIEEENECYDLEQVSYWMTLPNFP